MAIKANVNEDDLIERTIIEAAPKTRVGAQVKLEQIMSIRVGHEQ